MKELNPPIAVARVAEAQAIRDRHLGPQAFTPAQLAAADDALQEVCSRPECLEFVVRPAHVHEYVSRSIVFTCGWYAGLINYKDPHKPPLRTQVIKVVLFRECFVRHSIGQNMYQILNSVCDIAPIRSYAESGCEALDLRDKHFFLHSSLSSRFLGSSEYAAIDGKNWATILYPMYESGILAAIVAFLTTILGVEYAILRNKKKKPPADETPETLDRLKKLEHEMAQTREFVKRVLLEMEIRQHLLLEKITDELGRIRRDELKALYLEQYLPAVEAFRESEGTQIPKGFDKRTARAEQYMQAIVPHFCNALTNEGARCRRVVPADVQFCWQHDEKAQEHA